MKQLILSALICGCMAGSYAQETNKKDTVLVITADSTQSHNGQKKTGLSSTIEEKDKIKAIKSSSKFSIGLTLARIDLGLSTYTDKGSYTLSPENSYLEHYTWKSSNFGFEFFQMGYRFNSNFKIYLAAGLDWNHIRLKQNITFQKNEPVLTYNTEPVEFEKNRFSSHYLRLPLSFELRTHDDQKGNKAYFVFGPEAGFLLNGKVKQISKERGKEKFEDDYNLEPLRYGAFARLGYNGMGIYAKYYFNDVFAKGQGPEDFKNLSFGLMLGF
jgi:opacity protein-like surface antigen